MWSASVTAFGALAGATIAALGTGAGFFVVIDNQAWPAGGHAVAESRFLFILALMPAWILAAVGTWIMVAPVTRSLGGSKRAAGAIGTGFFALSCSFHFLMLCTWKN